MTWMDQPTGNVCDRCGGDGHTKITAFEEGVTADGHLWITRSERHPACPRCHGTGRDPAGHNRT